MSRPVFYAGQLTAQIFRVNAVLFTNTQDLDGISRNHLYSSRIQLSFVYYYSIKVTLTMIFFRTSVYSGLETIAFLYLMPDVYLLAV